MLFCDVFSFALCLSILLEASQHSVTAKKLNNSCCCYEFFLHV